jgi:hypothetical protein
MGKVLMRTIVFAVALLIIITTSVHAVCVALLILPASAHAAGPASNAIDCKPNTAQIDGHQVTTQCASNLGTHEEWRNEDGNLDRTNGPAYIMRDAKTGTVTFEQWFKDGKLHRTDGPAAIERDSANGLVIDEQWRKDGNLDRADGPALIVRDAKTGAVTFEQWFKDGKLHRTDGPAIIMRDSATGAVTYEEWGKDGKRIAPPRTAAR